MGSRPPRPPRPPLHVKKEFRIKKEAPDDEIKEYAETAMNEFLGWYGYDKVDSRDTQGLDLHHFARRRSVTEEDSSDDARSCSPTASVRQDHPSRNSPEPEGSSSTANGCVTCCWCNKTATHKSFSLKTPAGLKFFCSELCFTQCRRANFKRNKTCDWCRHIRHTVNYVDFQDGEHQLQFCSDKCLNQYKMNIFCKETEAHLQLHPHLAENSGAPGGPGGLITPDLWLRDCRSASPHSATPSPSPELPRERKDEPTNQRKKGCRVKKGKNSKSPHLYPPPLLPLNGGVGLFPPNLPHPRPSFLNVGYYPHMFPAIRGPRMPSIAKPPSPPPVMPPPPRPPPPSLLPPVTVLIPYPIPIPLPIPVPIPIPVDISKLPFCQKQYKKAETEDEKPDLTKEAAVAPTSLPSPEPQLQAASHPSSSREPTTNVSRSARKRRRVIDLPKDAEVASKRKTVPA